MTSYTGAQPANANNNGDPADQFVAKHFPTPWFNSLTGQSAGMQNSVTYTAQPALNEPSTPEYDGPGAPTSGVADTNCDANHVSNLDDPTYGLAHDLSLPANEVPSFNWITPNNCSDAHDASCQGNNLSGAFNANGSPNYTPSGLPADDPEATTPTNYTGGLYAADLFLRYYIPMIEQSAAFADGGLIDITFDESNPPFTTGNSFNNVPAPGDKTTSSAPADQPTFGSAGTTAPGATSLYGAYGALTDAAGENINGHNVNTEPTGPNDPEVTNSSGQQLQPGPGAAGFIDRPTGLAGESPNVSGSPGTASEPAVVGSGSSMVIDSKINAQDTGRLVSGTDGGQHDPARHLRRGRERHRAVCVAVQRQHRHRVEQLRQAVDRYVRTAERQRNAGHTAERLQRQRDARRRGRDVDGRQPDDVPDRQRGGDDRHVPHR